MARAGRRSRRRRQTGGQTPKPRREPREQEAVPATTAAADAVPATQPATVAVPAAQAVRPRRGTPRPTAPTQTGGGGRRGRLYRWTHPRLLTETVAELRKVIWPSRAETRSLTTVVIVIAVAVGVLLGSVDWIFNRLMENVLLN
jgi:preprotein translocase subunit SecE